MQPAWSWAGGARAPPRFPGAFGGPDVWYRSVEIGPKIVKSPSVSASPAGDCHCLTSVIINRRHENPPDLSGRG